MATTGELRPDPSFLFEFIEFTEDDWIVLTYPSADDEAQRALQALVMVCKRFWPRGSLEWCVPCQNRLNGELLEMANSSCDVPVCVCLYG